jgi:murein tripeptide amidase MpaA
MRNISSKIIVCLILLLLTIGTFSSAANHQRIEKEIEKPTETCQLQYEYYNYQDMTDLFYNLEETYPEIMSYASLGETYEERNVWMVKLSDNVEVNEDEPGVLLMGAHHGNEKPSYESLIFFIKHMVENYGKENTDDDGDGALNEDIIDGVDNDGDSLVDEDPSEDRVREVIDNTEIFVIPMVNPDGVEANTRKNRAPKEGQANNIGVDLNRNYAFKWELYNIFPGIYNDAWTSNPESWNYRGGYPFSEKESSAVKDFVESEDIKISLSYHSYGEFIVYPWTHTSQITPHENQFISIGDGISSINGYYFYKGRGTILPWPGGIIGTSENWLYGVQDILSFTIELCKTRAPTNPVVVHEYCVTHVGVNLYICERAPSVKLIKNIVDRPYPFLRVLSFLQNLHKTL